MSERRVGFRDGFVLGKGNETYIIPAIGNYGITVAIPQLRSVTWILKWSFFSNPVCSHGTVENEWIQGNVVGCTLIGVSSGTTLDVEVVALGV